MGDSTTPPTTPRVQSVAYGRPAALALRDVVAEAQRDDPLTPVTVVVARSSVGLAMRRLLASGDLGVPAGRTRAGLANVSFTTLRRVANQHAGPVLAAAGRRPLSTAVLHGALRQALLHAPEVFAPIRSHPATVTALARVWRDLRGATPETRAQLAAGTTRASAVFEVLDRVDAQLADRFDEHDLFVAAAAALRADPAQATTTHGTVVVHLPERLAPEPLEFLRVLVDATDTTVLLGVTGTPDADGAALEMAAAFGVTVAPLTDPLHAERFVSAPSADTEVLHAVRTVAQAHRNGTPLDRIAVLTATDAPYQRMLHEELSRNDIAHHGPGVRSLSATLAGRTLLGLLALPEDDFRRDQVLSWLASAPLRHNGRPLPSAAWDRVSRSAGVVRGAQGWQDRLTLRREQLFEDRTKAERDQVGEARLATMQSEADACVALAAFVQELTQLLAPEQLPTTWSKWAAWARQRLDEFLGGQHVIDVWPNEERQALEEVRDALERLSVLDEVDPSPKLATFTQALRTELSAGAPTTTRFGLGVLVAPYRLAIGLDLDLVVMVGMTDTALPGRSGDDPLVPDAERLQVDATLPLRSGHQHDVHHNFLAAVRSAPRRVFSYPRGDLRNGRDQRPARWWLDALGATRGVERPLFARDLQSATSGERLLVLTSHTATLLADGEPTGPADHDLRALTRHRLHAQQAVHTHWLVQQDESLQRSLHARAARRAHDYTRFDGRAGELAAGRALRPFSPTALETYAKCPRRYLLGRELGVQAPVVPERLLRMEPRERGLLVHEVLERFVQAQLDLPESQRLAPTQPWTAAHHEALDTLLDEVAGRYSAEGRAGHPVLWDLDLRVIRRDLHALLARDDQYRADNGATPAAVEVPVGFDGVAPLEVQLSSGRTVQLRGWVDRLDTTVSASGARGAVVLDYKNSASATSYKSIHDDSVAKGTLLQPVMYGLMARQHLGDPNLEVRAGFWLTRYQAAYEQVIIDINDTAVARFDEVVSVLVDGIEAGDFPARPGKWKNRAFEHCHFCDYETVCSRDRAREWERVRDDSRLADYVTLVEPETPDADAEGEDEDAAADTAATSDVGDNDGAAR